MKHCSAPAVLRNGGPDLSSKWGKESSLQKARDDSLTHKQLLATPAQPMQMSQTALTEAGTELNGLSLMLQLIRLWMAPAVCNFCTMVLQGSCTGCLVSAGCGQGQRCCRRRRSYLLLGQAAPRYIFPFPPPPSPSSPPSPPSMIGNSGFQHGHTWK